MVKLYPPAEDKLADIWLYSSQWGDEHADNYINDLFRAMEQLEKANYHRAFPACPIWLNKVRTEVFYHLWNYKSNTPAHTIFYRMLSDGEIGIIEISGSGQNKDAQLVKAMKSVEFA